ncbi:GIY-YIG nuclease family protein [[Kitasatospora] papulosa]
MPRTFAVDLDVAGHQIGCITLNWGLRPISDVREAAPTYGTDIEVPAVVELLDLVASGAVTAEEARDSLNNLATAINKKQDREYERMLENMEQVSVCSPRVALTQNDTRWVYAVSSDDDPKVIKIGVAGDIERRIKTLQTGAASRIVLRWSARGGLRLESHLHEKFRRRRMSGEWFDFRRVSNPVKVIEAAAEQYGLENTGASAPF